MRGLTTFAQYLGRSALVVCVISLAAACAAQEVDPPTPPDAGDGEGSLLAPSAWVVLSAPVQKPIGLKFSGFYIGELDTPVAQVDVPIRMAKFLTVTPSYMGNSVPATEEAAERHRTYKSVHERALGGPSGGQHGSSASRGRQQ